MPLETTVLLKQPETLIIPHRLTRYFLLGLLFLIFNSVHHFAFAGTISVAPNIQKDESVFLVATEKLHGTSFQQTVILLTHNSRQGATGLTINRPTDISLQEAFPGIRQLKQRTDPLYLGGPVSTNAIFVLLKTHQPTEAMHRIAGDIYFATGKNAFTNALDSIAPSGVRTYAGYAGWTAGQLQNEIRRGDWLMVHTDPKIIFEKDTESLWQRLTKRWSGKWI